MDGKQNESALSYAWVNTVLLVLILILVGYLAFNQFSNNRQIGQIEELIRLQEIIKDIDAGN